MGNSSFDEGKFTKRLAEDIWTSDKEQVFIEDYCRVKLRQKCKSLGDLTIEEMIPSIVNRTSRILQKKIEHQKNRGIPPDYDFVPYPPNTLFKYHLLSENGFSDMRSHRKEILKTMCRMKSRSFEYLCEHILNINRIVVSGVTPGKKDGGVDFWGILEMDKFLEADKTHSGLLFKGVKFKIIGQAKRYKNTVGDGEVRIFETHYMDLLQGRGRAVGKIPDWFNILTVPILPIFITTNKFSKDAKYYAKTKGIVLKEGEEIVEDLIKSSHAKQWFYERGGKLFFNTPSFMKLFKKDNVK